MPNTKISALTAATILAGSEAVPIAVGGANARITPDMLAAHALRNLGRPLIIGGAGDSIGDFFMGNAATNGATSAYMTSNSPLAWALADYPADVFVDGRSYANGGYNFAVGGTTSAQMLANQLPQIVARPPDILFIQTCQNDNIVAVADVATFAPNVENTALGAIAAGVKLVVILSVPPHNTRTAAQRARALAGINERFSRFARTTPGVIYIDTLALALDPTYATAGALVPYKGVGAPTVFGSYSADGVHFTNFGAKSMSGVIADLFRSMQIPRRSMRANVFDGGYDAVNNPFGNILKSTGLFGGTAGLYNGSAAGNNVATGWGVSDNNGVIVTPSFVTDSLGYRAQRLTLSGTASANATITFAAQGGPTFISPAPSPGDFGIEAVLNLVALLGVDAVSLSVTAGGISTAYAFSSGPAAVTKELQVMSRRPATFAAATSWNFTLTLSIPNGITPSGSIDISRFGVFREA